MTEINNFLNTNESKQAKYEAEHNEVEIIGNLADFNKWIDEITKTSND